MAKVRMAMLAVLLGLVGCSGSGADGMPVPPAGALDSLQRPTTPNTSLAGPEGFSPKPDIVTPVYAISAKSLFAAVTRIAESTPRATKLASYDGRLEAAYVVRSRVFNFPDTIAFKIAPSGSGSTLVLYSASRYGDSDFGVNRARVEAWLETLRKTLAAG